ncbi:conserved hypothetical protein [Nitrosococcus halophilus Nc 4]|uniref:Uncharacterized protein n=1 Tax=Nitrosococcus halophilus (strain Nc4) TaxID=472759 RepID=D5BYU9_NITHN|nr:hypothetical protein [Nitrosococcus halophilus]ADE14162.1 conserved hypothetical protein [Nitrosococcus halophilus Nc 4]
MTVIVQEVYTAFKEAGVSEESARSAAEALTGYGDRFHDLEREMDRRFNEVDQRFNEITREMDRRFNEVDHRFNEVDQRFNRVDVEFEKSKGVQRLLQWMLGFNLALTAAVLFLLLRSGI